MDDATRAALARQLGYVIAHSPLYQAKFAGLRVDTESLHALPFTEKDEILADQAQHPPFGANLCVDPSRVQRVQKTSGTSARPVFIALTAHDIDKTTEIGARCFSSAGLRPDDTVVHCLNYCLWMGGYTDHESLERTGATVVPYGVGNTAGLIDTIRTLRVTAIHCTPSYLAKLETVLDQEFALSPRDLGLRIGLFAGEGGLQSPEFRRCIEETWGMIPVNANYGVSEALSMIAAENACRDGLRFMADGVLLPELIDPTTGAVLSIETGVQGELVVTNLDREAQPLVRYRTRDVLHILDNGPGGFRFEILGRSDQMLVVKGINLFPSAIATVLGGFTGRLNGEYQIVISNTLPLQALKIRAESVVELDDGDASALAEAVANAVKIACAITPEVEILPKGRLPRTEGKTVRVVRECG
ncbi:MAG TPA: AMP-binding protein [Candidatus Hydrogenedentes bacterium]|nr:AMP-binding protein [Candidatus Hydrogenedentota bacterium]HOS02209.1 AMP-binding protein [Candidatus Hydrogenedentota bacterium]